jgi:threonylcarbamoyladenosine tRNA methylthiotransferase MtaB
MFENTLRLISDCGLTFTHVFPFSARPGTPAARMPRLEKTVIKERAARLRAAGEAATVAHLETRLGAVERVLIEKDDFGHTEQFVPVRVAGGGVSNLPPGDIVAARVVARDGLSLRAEALPGSDPRG